MIENRKSENQISSQTEVMADVDTSKDVAGEFKVSIRKLEMPVLPRGVLAE